MTALRSSRLILQIDYSFNLQVFEASLNTHYYMLITLTVVIISLAC